MSQQPPPSEQTGNLMSETDFEAVYAADADPWRVETSWYERRKLGVLLASLPREHYPTAWEPGCGIGVATEALAGRVGSLVASDLSATAVARTTRRTAHLGGVRVVRSALPAVPFEQPVDLVVVAEFLYYVEPLAPSLDALWSALAPGGHLVLLHWSHLPHDAARSGPALHDEVLRDAEGRGAVPLLRHVDEDFRLDVLEARA